MDMRRIKNIQMPTKIRAGRIQESSVENQF